MPLLKKYVQMMCTVMNLLRKGMMAPIWSIMVFSAEDMIATPIEDRLLGQPTLQASDIHDVQAEFVADPFIVEHNSQVYMFFEVLNKASGRGEIGVAISVDGSKWSYDRIVLREPFHLSYPQVFKDQDEWFMIPETIGANRVLLYKAVEFPSQWTIAAEMMTGRYLDPTLVKHNDKWWLFAGSEGKNLHLFCSDHLEGPWKEHPRSPIVTNDISAGRPGGRIISVGDYLYRYSQDGTDYYGRSLKGYKINKLSELEYEDEEMPVILKGTDQENDWRRDGMHHMDQLRMNNNQWLVAVDGHRFVKWNYIAWKMDRIKAKYFS